MGPEWAGYLAAFEAYIDARKNGDMELAVQARRLMLWFAEPLCSDRLASTSPGGHEADRRRSEAAITHDLEPLLAQVGLL